MEPFALPRNLVESVQHFGDDRQQVWMAALPTIVQELAQRWSIDYIGEPFQPGGQTAWVAPVGVRDDADLVMKVGWRHFESAHEAEGLRAWAGRGAVRLRAAAEFDDTVALLIERCVPGSVLAKRPEAQQDVVIAGLLRRLWIEPPSGHVFRPLQVLCDQWADEFEEAPGPLDPGLARHGIALLRSLPATADRRVLLCTDLHAENVLAAVREPWLVIDPKPFVGDPTFDALQHLLNCEERLLTDPRGLALRMADLLDLDADRLVSWLFARCVQESPNCPRLEAVARRLVPP